MEISDYIKIFEQSSELLVVIDTGFVIVAASDLFLKSTSTVRENIVGCNIFDVFPDNPNDETANRKSRISDSFNRVLKNKIPDALPVVKYHTPKPELKDGGFEVKYWQATNSPLLDENNNVKYIIQRAQDVTENNTLITQLEYEQKALKLHEDSEKRYSMMLMKSPFGFAVFKGNKMVITLANDSIKEFWGKGKEVEGKPLFEVIPELKDSAFPGLLDKVYTTGIPFYGDELFAPILRNGKQEDVYFNFVYQPYLEADETISGVTVIAYEVTDSVIVKNALAAKNEAEHKALKLVEESNTRYHTMLMQSPFAFSVMKGKDMVITLANDLIKEFWGKGTDVEGKPLLQLLPELIDQPFPGMIEKVYTTGIPVYANEILGKVTYNGQLKHKYFNVVFQPYYEADNSISGVTQIAYEVTEMVMARKKIETSEARFKSIVMQTPVAIGIYKGKEYIAEIANEHCLQMINKGVDFVGKPLFDSLPELETQGFKGLMDNVMESGTTYYGNELAFNIDKNNISTQGFYNFIIKQLRADDESVTGIVVVASEVTEQVLARQKVEESEEHFRQMADLMPSKISNAAADGSVTYFSKKWVDFSGYTFKELRDFGYHKMMHPDEMEEFQQRFQKATETGTDLVMEMRFKNKQGDYVWHLNIASPIKDKNGIHKMWIGVTTEIHEQKIVAEKIKASEERFRLLVIQAPVAIFVLRGEDFIIETMNQEMSNFLDREIEDSLNKPLFDVISEVKDQVYKGLLDTVYKTGTRFVSQELPLVIHRNGKLEDVFVKFVYEPLREADGTVSGVMVLAEEITVQVNARKAVEVNEKKFRLLTNNMPQKITNADAEGNVTFFNQQWLDDTGLTFEELRDWGWEKAMHPDDLEPTVNNWKHSVATGDIFDMECRIQNKEGDFRWYLSRAVPVKDETGKIIMWVGSNTDIHELKEAKSKAETAQTAAEDAMQGKQQFLSNMSHEIRTPMNAILGFANVLLKSKLDQTQEEYLTAIKVSGDALLVLINDILDLAKVDAGKMTFEQTPFHLADSLSAMLQLFDIKIKEKNLELAEQFDPALPEIVLGDPIRLRQIILNLISNAVKFTETGKITMDVSLLQQDAEKVTIAFTITDTGIGIHKNKLDHIFDDFGQATYENSRLYGGTGLGLTIVKKLIEQQGGSIHVESKLGKGSAFSFQLSFAKTNQKITHKTELVSNKPVEIKNIKVLVAEDMPLNQLLIKILLVDFGFEVDIADNGKIAIEKLQQKQYDLVLMDLQMPVMNGFEATEHIRIKMNSQIPIIALTADVTTVDVGKCEAVGMNDYISKPVDEKLLYSKIIKHIKKNH